MKQTDFRHIVSFLLIVLLAVGAFAQENSVDDQGYANTPLTNPRANACYTGGTMAGTCETLADWECGWALIRFEYGLLPRNLVPNTCASLLPDEPVFIIEAEHTASTSSQTSQPGPGPVIVPTATATATADVSPLDCYFNWARYPVPALEQQVSRQLEQAGLENVNVNATAFGEDCISYTTGQIVYFAAMETDFDITVSAPDLSDETVRQTLLPKILDVLDTIPAQDLAGHRVGQKDFTFVSPTGQTRQI
jgi:hypothetical protein